MPDFGTNTQLQVQWGAIVAMCCGVGDTRYRLSHAYIEFANVDDPDEPVAATDFARDDGQTYYQELSESVDRDYLRVPLLTTPRITVADGYSGLFPAGLGNVLTFYTQTSGTVGQHGKPFSHLSNSKVIGVAIVATPDANDPSQDLIFYRGYLDPEQQVVKTQSGNVGITCSVNLV